MKGTVFDIQHYALYDGPGIRSTIFFKGCPLRCRWCHNPESQAKGIELSYNEEQCAACLTCVSACPSAISADNNRPSLDRKKCRLRGECVASCPTGALSFIGREMTADEIMRELLPEKPFYDNSGGGATITGGEPTLQTEFLLELLGRLKEGDISAALETCGHFRGEIIDSLVPLCDLFLFDVKHLDSEKHRDHTGRPNETILENLSLLVEKAGVERVIPRVPLIPGFNTDGETISAMGRLFAGMNIPRVHLMPYNPMGESKYRRVAMEDRYYRYGEQTEEDLRAIKNGFTEIGLEVYINQ